MQDAEQNGGLTFEEEELMAEYSTAEEYQSLMNVGYEMSVQEARLLDGCLRWQMVEDRIYCG